MPPAPYGPALSRSRRLGTGARFVDFRRRRSDINFARICAPPFPMELRLPSYRAFMTDPEIRRLERRFDRIERLLPGRVARVVRRLRGPDARHVRVPAGILLVTGGLLAFLPVFGLWMLPLGVLLMAQDVAVLRRPTGRVLIWGERKLLAWKRRRRRSTR